MDRYPIGAVHPTTAEEATCARAALAVRRIYQWRAVALAALVLLSAIGTATAVPVGSSTARESLTLCEQAEGLTAGAERDQLLVRGMALADAAVAADPRDALAHFATVCNLGNQMETAGIGFGQLVRLPRLRRELDLTLELAPDDADAMVAKGALLLHLPRLLGGDVPAAEGLLRHALAVEPDNHTASCYLAQVLIARGADDEARALHSHC
jgi:hypothetical protein